jgi:alpha-tubulin suppressor-like RCC1 family protein
MDVTSNFDLQGEDKITSMALGFFHSSALSSLGNVFTWGYNSGGQLGDGTKNNKFLPIDISARFSVSNEESIISLSLGREHSAALSEDGRIFTWGSNFYGELGDGDAVTKSSPIEKNYAFSLRAADYIINIDLNSNHSSAVSMLGDVFMWGSNNDGQLGIGTPLIYRNTIPINITF